MTDYMTATYIYYVLMTEFTCIHIYACTVVHANLQRDLHVHTSQNTVDPHPEPCTSMLNIFV